VEPDTFFLPYERHPEENLYYAALGRLLAYATRFEWNCRGLSKIIAIRENREIVDAPPEERAIFMNKLEMALASHIKRLVPRFVEIPGLSIENVFDNAKAARNTVAHEVALNIEHRVQDPFRREQLLTNLTELAKQLAVADMFVCAAISIINQDPLPTFGSTEYENKIASWVRDGAA